MIRNKTAAIGSIAVTAIGHIRHTSYGGCTFNVSEGIKLPLPRFWQNALIYIGKII